MSSPAAGPDGPRAQYGALQGDLAKLHALFGPKPEVDAPRGDRCNEQHRN